MVNRITLLTNILDNDQFSGTVIVSKTLRNQKCPVGEIIAEIRIDIENQYLHRTATIGVPDFFQNVRLYYFKVLRHVEDREMRSFQLRIDDSPKQV